MFTQNVPEIAIIVAAILAVAVRTIWYSPLVFGSFWVRELSETHQDTLFARSHLIISSIQGVIVHIGIFGLLSHMLVTYSADIYMHSKFTIALVLLVSLFLLYSVIWEGKTMRYFCINAAYIAIVLLGGMGIIFYWPW